MCGYRCIKPGTTCPDALVATVLPVAIVEHFGKISTVDNGERKRETSNVQIIFK